MVLVLVLVLVLVFYFLERWVLSNFVILVPLPIHQKGAISFSFKKFYHLF